MEVIQVDTDEDNEWFDPEDPIEKSLTNPNHPIYKVILALTALLTVLWTQNGTI